MHFFISLIVVVLQGFTGAETGQAYHGPPQSRELFSYNEELFYFYSDLCSYEEAAAICQAANTHLATLDDPGKARFAAETMAETWVVFEDMWIGAKKNDLGVWKWTFTKKTIPDESRMIGNYTYLYPPWIDNRPPMRVGKDCLAVDRNGHNDPYFVDLDCRLPRPFICQQNDKRNSSDPWHDGVIEIFNVEYMMYHGRLSWSAAVSFCRQQGFALATIENMTIAKKLAKAMLKSRPEFKDVWIGARFKDYEWVWVENGEELKTIPAEYKDPSKGDIPSNIIIPQFPPWLEPVPRRGRQCVIFDGHVCDAPKFVDFKCNRERDFVCMKKREQQDEQSSQVVIDRGNKRYTFFPISATWDEARTFCEEESEQSNMLTLTDEEETKFIMQVMSDARNPLNHIWLGGKIINGKWTWINRNEEEYVPIPRAPDDTGFPPWCDNETNIELSCLNLDRHNHGTPLMYGLECNATQSVVCTTTIESDDRVIDYYGAGERDSPIKLRISQQHSDPKSWFEAERACTHDIGKLWKPRFDLAGGEPALKEFFESMKKIQVSNGNDSSAASTVYYVDGGKYSAKKKAWIRDKRPLQINTTRNPVNGDCLVGQINDTSTDWSWYPVKCHQRHYAEIICEPLCSLTEVPYEAMNSEWLCDASASDVFDHKMMSMTCTHRCPEGSVLQGPDRFICTQNGWVSKETPLPVSASQCKVIATALDIFKNIPDGITSLAFVIDSTSDSPWDYNATKFLVGHLIDFYRANLAKGATVQVVSIELSEDDEDDAVHKIVDFIPTDNCKQIKTAVLDKLVDTGLGTRDYAAGLSKVRDALRNSLTESNIVFVVPEANQRNSFRMKAMEVNELAKVYAIGTNRHAPINQLVDVASTIEGVNFAMQFKKPSDVVTAVRALIQDCAQCKCATAFDYLVHELKQSGKHDKSTDDNTGKHDKSADDNTGKHDKSTDDNTGKHDKSTDDNNEKLKIITTAYTSTSEKSVTATTTDAEQTTAKR